MKQQIELLSSVFSHLRIEINKDLPIQHLAILLAVVARPGRSMPDLMCELKMPQGTISRNVKLLANKYELLYTEVFVENRKKVAVLPTEKCVQLVEELSLLMNSKLNECTQKCCCESHSA